MTLATAPLGIYTLTVVGTGGGITRTAQLTLWVSPSQVSMAASSTSATTSARAISTTTSTSITNTTTTPTSSTTTTPPPGPRCLIATATYGSELAPEVQFLRGFRIQVQPAEPSLLQADQSPCTTFAQSYQRFQRRSRDPLSHNIFRPIF